MGHRHLQHHQHCTMLHPTPFPNTGVNNLMCLLIFVCITLLTVIEGTDVTSSVEPRKVFKRSATEGSMGAAADYPDYQTGVRYDEYPVVVPKRTALLLDRIMVALQKAVEDEKGRSFAPDMMENKMDLQRRGQQKGRVYWRCYFNAVTCFKRK